MLPPAVLFNRRRGFALEIPFSSECCTEASSKKTLSDERHIRDQLMGGTAISIRAVLLLGSMLAGPDGAQIAGLARAPLARLR